MSANDWLALAEASIRRAPSSLPASEAVLDEASVLLRSARSRRPLDEETLARLKVLRGELFKLQVLARHGAALYIGLDQFDEASVIGYTPTGLERAL